MQSLLKRSLMVVNDQPGEIDLTNLQGAFEQMMTQCSVLELRSLEHGANPTLKSLAKVALETRPDIKRYDDINAFIAKAGRSYHSDTDAGRLLRQSFSTFRAYITWMEEVERKLKPM